MFGSKTGGKDLDMKSMNIFLNYFVTVTTQ